MATRTPLPRTSTARASRGADAPLVAGVRISHPDRLIYPDLGLRKIDLVRYYDAIAEWIVPHVAGRPLTLVHCPRGVDGPCAYLRHKTAWGPDVLRRVRIPEKTKIGTYLVADDAAGVVALVQMGVVEIHTWNAVASRIERPNRLVWDLDAGPEVRWPQMVAAARAVRELLRVLGLACWVKTTGGRGLHVVAPIEPRRDWFDCLAFARDVARALTRADPALYTIRFAKAGRERRILIDYLRNNRTNTTVCAYSSRARAGAPVSTPIAWDELDTTLRPSRFTVQSIPRRLKQLGGDPWDEYWKTPQALGKAQLTAVARVS